MDQESLLVFTKDSVKNLLYTSAGIFATMLAVTLGVTLLGVQFRSQSYTMSGMLEYMRDKVVYGFITVFIAGTVLSMAMAEDQGSILSIIITGSPVSSPGWIASYTIVGISLALCYHAAYIFHLVYKLQLSQMLSDNEKKIKKYLRKRDLDRLYTRFEIWEGIMEKAVETRNRTIFDKGMASAFGTIRESITDPRTFNVFSECVENVCKSCMDRAQYRFVDTYVREALDTYMALSQVQEGNKEWIKTIKFLMVGEMEKIMRRAIDDEEDGACGDYIEWMMESLWNGIRASDDWDQIDVICDCVERVIQYSILKNSGVVEDFVQMALDESEHDHRGSKSILVSDFPDGTYASEWYRRIFEILKRISLKIADDGEQFVFRDCMILMMRLCNKYEALTTGEEPPYPTNPEETSELKMIRMFSNHLSEVINISVAQNRYSILGAFKGILEYNLEVMTRSDYKGESGMIWRRALWVTFGAIMSKSAHTDDQATLSTVAVRTIILNHMLDNCDKDEVKSIIGIDIRCLDDAFDSATGKSHTGTTEMLKELSTRMEDMLRGRWENELADRYVKSCRVTESR